MMPSISKAARNAYLRVMPSIKSGFNKIKNGTSVRVQSLISALKNNDEKLFVGLGCNFGNINRKFFSKFKELYRKAKEALLKKLSKGGKYSETEIQNIINNLKGDGYKNNPLRQAYESEVAGLKAYGDELLSSGMSEEKVAQALNQARRDLGIKYKNATPQPLRDYIYEINRGRYGDELGPTYDYLIGKGKSDIDIINSSSRPNSNIDSLFSGFEEWLRR